jgi:hypothetical protein
VRTQLWPAHNRSPSSKRGITPRSTGAPTAGRQRPVGGTRYIFTARALASCRRRPVTSNVRPRIPPVQTASIPMSSFILHALVCWRLAFISVVRPLSAISRSQSKLPAMQTRGVHASAPCVHRACVGLWQARFRLARCPHAASQAWPNPSLKRSTNGRPPGPVWRYAVHFRQPGPGVLPLAPA